MGAENANNKARGFPFSGVAATVSETSGVATIMVTSRLYQICPSRWAGCWEPARLRPGWTIQPPAEPSFAAGEVSRSIPIILLDDHLQEVDETILLRLFRSPPRTRWGAGNPVVTPAGPMIWGCWIFRPPTRFSSRGLYRRPLQSHPARVSTHQFRPGGAGLVASVDQHLVYRRSDQRHFQGHRRQRRRSGAPPPTCPLQQKKGLKGDTTALSNRSTGVGETRVAARLTITAARGSPWWLQVDEPGTRATNTARAGRNAFNITNGGLGGAEGRLGVGAVWLSGAYRIRCLSWQSPGP